MSYFKHISADSAMICLCYVVSDLFMPVLGFNHNVSDSSN